MGSKNIMWAFLLLCFSVTIYTSLFLKNSYLLIQLLNQPPQVKIWTPVLEINTLSFNNENRIFFHETSGSGKLNFLQTCCIEAAARHHLKRPVQVFISANAISNFDPWLEILTQYKNSEVYLLDNYEYFKGTSFENWFINRRWEKSPFKTAHMSDYLRITTAERGGGLYMDLDLLTHRSFDDKMFRNFLVYETPGYDMIANTIFHFEQGHPLIKEIINVMSSEYDPNEYIYHGPEAFMAAMYHLCGLNRELPKTNRCDNVKLFSHALINPIVSFLSNLYFHDDGLRAEWLEKVNMSYATHHFGSIGHEQLKKTIMSDINSDHLFAKLARENCPFSVIQISRFQ